MELPFSEGVGGGEVGAAWRAWVEVVTVWGSFRGSALRQENIKLRRKPEGFLEGGKRGGGKFTEKWPISRPHTDFPKQ